MIRPFTILCFAAFAGAGAWLYHVKHEVTTLDRDLREVWRQTEQARDRTAILRAEWAMLNEPDRLRQVAQRHLTLEPMQPHQFTRLPEAVRRLPQAVAFAGPPNLFVPERSRHEAEVMLAAAQMPAPIAGAEDTDVDALPPPPPAAPPLLLAAARPVETAMRAAPSRPAATTEALRGDEVPAPQALAATLAAQQAAPRRAAPPVPPRAAPLRDATPVAPRRAAAPPQAMQPAVLVAPARPAAPVLRTTQAAPRAPAPTYVSALGAASSLGRPTLAPPVPFSSANAATLNSTTR
ncbi:MULTISPECIES: cell division protein FtsL [Roseomonadaceae]|uniref:Cell division protein FtsL n=1 Tax=Falsiroseomonas oleicola TaxID=2801474 RepID=A0ABS6HH02_9PROT|nr:hypothetical protein [Roseomonas oleicola]MBU8546565.1 hypothetical protein [Roseomonas oleicola]